MKKSAARSSDNLIYIGASIYDDLEKKIKEGTATEAEREIFKGVKRRPTDQELWKQHKIGWMTNHLNKAIKAKMKQSRF